MKIVCRHVRPLTVLYARSFGGPYVAGTREAWETMNGWLDCQKARTRMRVSYGLFRDNPRIVAPDLLRYDACIPLVPGLEDDAAAGIGRQMLPGGSYAVYTHVGALEGAGDLFSELYRKEIPARGLTIDEERPFLATYLTDPLVTREMHRRSEVCVPIYPLPTLLAGNDDTFLEAQLTRAQA